MMCASFGMWLALVAGVVAAPEHATGQATDAVRGAVVSQVDGAPLADVIVTFIRAVERDVVATVVSDELGEFRVASMAPGRYIARAVRDGFLAAVATDVVVRRGQTATLRLEMALAMVREDVTVSAAPANPVAAAVASPIIAAGLADIAPIEGDNFRALLPVLPGVIRRPDGRLSLQGGRPEQSGLQVSDANVTDPVTGSFGMELPIDAIESIEVLASPYTAEYGRFSSGIARIETRRSENEWHTSVTNFVPFPLFRNGGIRGIRSFGPRLLVGGALVEDKVFLTQSFELDISKIRVRGLPDGENYKSTDQFSSFTRLDVNIAEAHQLMATLAYFPRDQDEVTLDTLNPLPVTPDLQERGFQVDLADTVVVGGDTLLTSRFTGRQYNVDVLPEGDDAMVLRPDGRSGSFFSRQDHDSTSVQWIETVSRAVGSRRGTHLVKGGFDLLYATYHGTSDFRPVDVVRADGTRAWHLDFPGVADVSASATDLAVFAQDRWRVNDRLLVDLGVRFDRDGVTKDSHLSPRAGATIGVLPDGRGILRGGLGRFYQRTPLNIASFESLEPRVVTRYDAAGLNVASTDTYLPRSEADETPRAFIWSLEYSQHLTDRATLKVGHLRRSGHHEFIVEPVADERGGALALRSEGNSVYHETEITGAFRGPNGLALDASYVYSSADGDFNAFDRLFGDLADPIVRPNAYGPRDIDVPHRLIVRGTLPIGEDRWVIAPLIEIRTGFPYSVLDQDQAFLGVPNRGGRFPVFKSIDLAINRTISIKGRRVVVGIRAYNLLNTFNPRDVQNNLASPTFGAFANGIERRLGLTVQFNR